MNTFLKDFPKFKTICTISAFFSILVDGHEKEEKGEKIKSLTGS